MNIRQLLYESSPQPESTPVDRILVCGRRRSRRHRALAVSVGVVGLAVAAVIVNVSATTPGRVLVEQEPGAGTQRSGTTPTSGNAGQGVPARAARSIPTRDITNIPLPASGGYTAVIATNNGAWILGTNLHFVDQRTGRVSATLNITGLGLAYSGSSIWILGESDLSGGPLTLTEVDPSSLKVQFRVAVQGSHAYGNTNPRPRVVVADGSVWVSEGDRTLVDVDPRSGRQVARVSLPSAPGALAADGRAVWAISYGGTTLMRVDTRTRLVTTVDNLGSGFAQTLAAEEAVVWTTRFGSEPSSNRVAQDLVRTIGGRSVFTHLPTAFVAAGNHQVWFLGYQLSSQARSPANDPGLLGQIDPTTLRVEREAHLDLRAQDTVDLAVGGDTIWVLDMTRDAVIRVKTSGK